MIRSLILAILLAAPVPVLADYLPRSVGSPLGADVVVAVDTSASMTYDLCGDNQYNYCYGDGDTNPRLAGQRTFCKTGDGRSRFQHLKRELRDSVSQLDSGKLALLHSGQNWDPSPEDCEDEQGRPNCTPASSYRYPPGPRGQQQLLHMAAPTRALCLEEAPDFGSKAFVSVDTQPILDSRPVIMRWLNGRSAQGDNPSDPELRGVGSSNAQGMLNLARRMHVRNARNGADDQEICRRHYTVYLTDSVEWCSTSNNSRSRVRRELTEARNIQVGADTIGTMVVGFGPDFRHNSNREILNGLARAGGLAIDPETGNVDNFAGEALVARRPEDLSAALNQVFARLDQGEFQGGRSELATLWTTETEVGRVRDNGMLVPTTELPGHRGHLYAFRLFHETLDYSNEWTFRGEPSLRWDAGALLAGRSSYPNGNQSADNPRPRRMFSALEINERGDVHQNFPGGSLRRVDFTWPIPQEDRILWYRNTRLKCAGDEPATHSCRTLPDIDRSGHALGDDFDRRLALGRVVMRLRGARIDTAAENAAMGDEIVDESRGFIDSANQWKLGPLVHSSPIAGELGLDQSLLTSDPSYKVYADAVKDSPPMIYVPAGHLIHAFFTNDSEIDGYELLGEEHEAGEEVWAYLPRSVQPRLREAFSKDFSDFRHDQLSMMDNRCRIIEAKLDLDQARARGGWSAVLVCAMGTGGRHMVALDVSNPEGPVPLWEFTHGDLGETWSLPVLGRIKTRDGEQAVAVFASGVDNIPGTGGGSNCRDRWCNDRVAVFVVDLSDGSLILHERPRLPQNQGVMADISALDHDGDGYLDFAYIGTTKGKLLTLHFLDNGPRLTKRRGTYNGALAMTGAPVLDLASLGAESLDLLLTSAEVHEEGDTGRKGGLRVYTDGRAGQVSTSSLSAGCNLLRATARGSNRYLSGEHPVGRPLVAKRTAFFTTIQGGPTCGGATHRLRCVDLEACAVTCNVVLCDPAQQACGAEPAPPSYLADGRLYTYSPDLGRLNAVVRVTPSGIQEAVNGSFPLLPGEGAGGGNLESTKANQNQPKNLMMHWREVY